MAIDVPFSLASLQPGSDIVVLGGPRCGTTTLCKALMAAAGGGGSRVVVVDLTAAAYADAPLAVTVLAVAAWAAAARPLWSWRTRRCAQTHAAPGRHAAGAEQRVGRAKRHVCRDVRRSWASWRGTSYRAYGSLLSTAAPSTVRRGGRCFGTPWQPRASPAATTLVDAQNFGTCAATIHCPPTPPEPGQSSPPTMHGPYGAEDSMSRFGDTDTFKIARRCDR